MSRIAYEEWNPSDRSLGIVKTATAICEDYARQGYNLTLRQLYYQFVARDLLPNNQQSYSNLGATIDRARKAGYLDWNYIVDRTRNLSGYRTYRNPASHIEAIQDQHHIDLWDGQEYAVEVWVEKEALADVVGRAALAWGLDYFSCRGYVSQSELHSAAKRHVRYMRKGRTPIVIHLGDHDPSGIDMTRDMQDRLNLFGADTEVRRIALNFDQVEQYNPPPNPAKLTDSRAGGYIAEHGRSSWELDALDPTTLAGLIDAEVQNWVDPDLYDERVEEQEQNRQQLALVSTHWNAVRDLLDTLED